MIQIDFPDSTTTTYKYDGLGRRIEKNVNGSITRYVYDGKNIALEYDGTNTFVARYSHGQQTDQPLAVQRAGIGFFYYQSDHQGSIINLSDSSGGTANSYQYDSYGRVLSVAETVSQPYAYTARELDGESGLYYYRARYYDPQSGRFLSEDPIGFEAGDQNLYRYVFNNPINLADPSGLAPRSCPAKDCSHCQEALSFCLQAAFGTQVGCTVACFVGCGGLPFPVNALCAGACAAGCRSIGLNIRLICQRNFDLCIARCRS